MQLTGSSRAGKMLKTIFFILCQFTMCSKVSGGDHAAMCCYHQCPSVSCFGIEIKGNSGRAALVHHLIWNKALEAVQVSNYISKRVVAKISKTLLHGVINIQIMHRILITI